MKYGDQGENVRNMVSLIGEGDTRFPNPAP
jgi:hypothetical protein